MPNMATGRKRVALPRRRRLDDEGEDDQSVATELADDSQSDVSIPSDVDEDADADNSDLSDVDSSPSLTPGKPKTKLNGAREVKPAADINNKNAPSPPIARSDIQFTATRDTEIMLNGLKLSDKAGDSEAIDFETNNAVLDDTPITSAVPPARPESFAERKRKEHEEYKKKRDSDPAFIPNRGAFFMHDQRSSGYNNFRGYGRGRGRGRGGIGGPYPPANMMAPTSEPTDAPWQHDLHETVIDTAPPLRSQLQAAQPTTGAPSAPAADRQAQLPAKPPVAPPATTQNRNFSTTVHTHNAVVRVFLPGMKGPIHFQNVPIKQHTRLPNHRPPLRRDKPVRISLPEQPPRYIFPTVDRSFIFIPRALRPNQQGFGRGRGRGIGSFGGGFSSRRTSAYGGSVYSPSVAMSRRSSLAREIGREGLVSPAGSMMSRGAQFDASRPVPYPLPQKPTFRENWQGQLPMHQPRPQKTVSVAGIESPASMNFHPPQQQEQQPFHQQVPAQLSANPTFDQPPPYVHVRQFSHTSQASSGTPLSNIPERAIHAPAFQPFQQPGFQPQGFPMQPGYYYPVPNGAQQPFVAPGGMVPMFVPNPQQSPYVMPMVPVAQPVPTSAPAPPALQSNMVAYEQNGMTYYVDSSQLYPAPPVEGYPQASYAVPGMGGMMTPSPEGYYYSGVQPAAGVYYPAQ